MGEPIAREVQAYYARGGEPPRLFQSHGQIELARTQEIVLRCDKEGPEERPSGKAGHDFERVLSYLRSRPHMAPGVPPGNNDASATLPPSLRGGLRMDPAQLPQTPYPLAPDSQTARESPD